MGIYTQNGIYMPSTGERNWDDELNENFTLVNKNISDTSNHLKDGESHITSIERAEWNNAVQPDQVPDVINRYKSAKTETINFDFGSLSDYLYEAYVDIDQLQGYVVNILVYDLDLNLLVRQRVNQTGYLPSIALSKLNGGEAIMLSFTAEKDLTTLTSEKVTFYPEYEDLTCVLSVVNNKIVCNVC